MERIIKEYNIKLFEDIKHITETEEEYWEASNAVKLRIPS